MKTRSEQLKRSMGKVQKGGVIVEVNNIEQGKIAERAGAVAIKIKDRFGETSIEQIWNIELIESILKEVSIPVIAHVRTGHLIEAFVLEEIGVDFADESERLDAVDIEHINPKNKLNIPFICGYQNLNDACRRISEGAAMVRTLEGSLLQTVGNLKRLHRQIRRIVTMDEHDLLTEAIHFGITVEMLKEIKDYGRLPVANFAVGGIQTPADVALVREIGADGVIIDNDIFNFSNPMKQIEAFVEAAVYYQDYKLITKLTREFSQTRKDEQQVVEEHEESIPLGVQS